jgi:hypothetical protein
MAVTVTVEDGSGVEDANSYQSVADWKTYADQMGWSHSAYTDDQIGSALIRGTAAIDMNYGARFPGVQTHEADQSLMWPRKSGYVRDGVFYAGSPATITLSSGWSIPVDEIPAALVRATAEAAWRELQSPGALTPDLERGGAIKSLKAGSVGIEYASTAPATTTYSILDGLMAGLLGPAPSVLTGRAVRV